ncbi:methylated-DNA--[protein]-cysteine S-methyltransferase [Conexibacter arvalis]|uniref:Methylated-DNA-[protein]-cysteine S-methyltransferase n=1 Tax=Conexibacter arvalis TaxID=912552 RepID=A0A840IJ99_9ACTN|nr:methylated-DNA--[protein]-cysteine S-methyltransferase [Conexibacter arvalis]MBB4664809.1 methylated-DNA-[protein]-cysteine S-methyltransferase [Conexibacter arvalis]
MAGFLLFDTAIGRCGIAWSERGLTAVALPGPSDAQLRTHLLRRTPGAVEHGAAPGRPAGTPLPPFAARARAGIVALLAGADDDLADIPLDDDGLAPFHARVYAAARQIRPGETTTYGALADRLGADRGAARAVGQALGANPWPIVVPCHRITAAGGRTGGFSAPGGVATKLRILDVERAHAGGDPTLF